MDNEHLMNADLETKVEQAYCDKIEADDEKRRKSRELHEADQARAKKIAEVAIQQQINAFFNYPEGHRTPISEENHLERWLFEIPLKRGGTIATFRIVVGTSRSNISHKYYNFRVKVKREISRWEWFNYWLDLGLFKPRVQRPVPWEWKVIHSLSDLHGVDFYAS